MRFISDKLLPLAIPQMFSLVSMIFSHNFCSVSRITRIISAKNVIVDYFYRLYFSCNPGINLHDLGGNFKLPFLEITREFDC